MRKFQANHTHTTCSDFQLNCASPSMVECSNLFMPEYFFNLNFTTPNHEYEGCALIETSEFGVGENRELLMLEKISENDNNDASNFHEFLNDVNLICYCNHF